MNKRIPITLGVLLLAFAAGQVLQAQPVRNGVDVLWAKDVAGAPMDLDGNLDEAAWAQAERLVIRWNEPPGSPGSGQKIEGNPELAEPLDGNDGTLMMLRNGNELWIGLDVRDKSIGGGRGLNAGNWFFDGFIMALNDRTRRREPPYTDKNNFNSRPAEFIMGWWHPADTLDGGLPVPGIAPRFFGDYGVGFGDKFDAERTPEKKAVLQWAHSIDGVANDDEEGDDVGYQFEVKIDVGLMGFDFTKEGGDQVPFGFALQDTDYNWPFDQAKWFTSRVWFQNQYANNFNEGVGYIYGAPGVTVAGAAPEVTEPVVNVFKSGSLGAPVVDGNLDEAVWDESPVLFNLQYEADVETMNDNPGTLFPYYIRWFRPDINGDQNAAVVVDPSLAKVKLTFEGNILYVGVDVDDQAINGTSGEDGRDGIRVILRDRTEVNAVGTLDGKQFDFWVDSTASVQYGIDAAAIREIDPDAVVAAVGLKGASTAADPSDIDEGYQIEIGINMTKALGYEDGMGDGRFWMGLNFFDGDNLESASASYATRVWAPGERASEASIYGYFNSAFGVASERDGVVPDRIALLGNYPNPFNPSTMVRFSLPSATDVSLAVFDMLGRRVSAIPLGMQAAGTHEVSFDASSLVSGVYLYRLESAHREAGSLLSGYGRMVLLK